MNTSDRDRQAASFGAAAGSYERARPSYPAAAVSWLLPHGEHRVLDLGAGTGQMSRALVARGLDVLAVEPSQGMREELSRVLPQISILTGSAEAIPLPDDAVDAVVVAQAWHWVDPGRAVPEVARVLRPGGRLGLVWNIRNERVDWVAELGALVHRGVEQDMRSDEPPVGAPFGPLESYDVPWTHRMPKQTLLDLVASRSYVITLPADERAELLREVEGLLDSHPELVGRSDVDLPYIARCSRTLKS